MSADFPPRLRIRCNNCTVVDVPLRDAAILAELDPEGVRFPTNSVVDVVVTCGELAIVDVLRFGPKGEVLS